MRRLTSLLLLVLVAAIGLPLLDDLGAPLAGPEYPAARPAFAQAALPPPPARWPSSLQLGMSSGRGNAATMKATTSFGFRYQYLAGGVNTGQGWYTWNTNGSFVTDYIQESVQNGLLPFFSYYMLLQSKPGGSSEAAADYTNLNNASTMQTYYNDLKL